MKPSPKTVDGLRTIVYVGQSMYPRLHDLDTLYITPCGTTPLSIGDVIAFNGKKGNRAIIVTHRIVAKGRNFYLTRGDNNRYVDAGRVTGDEIIGIVLYAKRGKKLIRVRGGRYGSLYAKAMHVRSGVKTIASSIFVYPYHCLSRSGLFRRLLPPVLKRRVIHLKRPNGTESQLLLGGLIIGKRKAGDSGWTIFPPYKLFIDEASLPDSPSIPGHGAGDTDGPA
jgi:signal peptidase I